MYRVDNWINEESGWIVESIESQYIYISTYRPLPGSSYVKLRAKLRSPKKGLINIKNKVQKCFLWCHVRHINGAKIHPERITQKDKKLVNDLDYDGIEFPVQEKDFSKIETGNNIYFVFGYENGLTFPIYVSEEKFETFMDLLLAFNNDKSHYLYIKDFNRFMFDKTKNKNKKHFCKNYLQCFSSKNVLTKHKKDCLSINGLQSVRIEKGTLKFKNYFKQIPVPFKIYVDFESNLEIVEIYEGSCTKKYQSHNPCSFAYKVVCVYNRFSKPIAVFRGGNAAYEFIKAILKEYKYCKKIMKKHFNKNLITNEEEQFQLSNVCWICKKLIDNDDEKVRDHCHVTGKFKDAAHWDCNINL